MWTVLKRNANHVKWISNQFESIKLEIICWNRSAAIRIHENDLTFTKRYENQWNAMDSNKDNYSMLIVEHESEYIYIIIWSVSNVFWVYEMIVNILKAVKVYDDQYSSFTIN